MLEAVLKQPTITHAPSARRPFSRLGLSARHVELVERLDALAAERIAPRADKTDLDASFPDEDIVDLHRAGLLLATLPEQDGGLGYGFEGNDPLSFFLIIERLARANPSTAHCYQVHCNALQILRAFGSNEQVKRFIQPTIDRGMLFVGAGSEPGGGRHSSTAVPVEGGFTINGVKHYATNATRCEWMTVHVRSESSNLIETFVVNTSSEGVEIDASVWNPGGMRACVSPLLRFKDCFVPNDCVLGHPEGFFGERWLAKINFGFTANYLGATQGIYDFAVSYLRDRGRKDTAQYQAHVGEMKAMLDAARLLFYRAVAATREDLTQGLLMSNEAKWLAVDVAHRVISTVGQVVGSTGFFRGLVLERLCRDLQVHTLHRRHHVGATLVGLAELGMAYDLNNS
ncbi:MAG TPA: acyl-CoA dehydrogenase family protein [Burkholderiales bacterium]|nr:acyl-CoA dehydrogenase family protein [Burkholderiales bacterium]